MSEPELANKDQVERFKPYIEIAKYCISVQIALAAVCGVIIRINTASEPAPQSANSLQLEGSLFAVGVLFNVILFVICHRLVSEATRGITHAMPTDERNDLLKAINNGTYSTFVIAFIGVLIFWSITIAVAALH